MSTITAKTPWKGCMGDVPMHLDYFEGSMFEAVEKIVLSDQKTMQELSNDELNQIWDQNKHKKSEKN